MGDSKTGRATQNDREHGVRMALALKPMPCDTQHEYYVTWTGNQSSPAVRSVACITAALIRKSVACRRSNCALACHCGRIGVVAIPF